MKTNRNKTRKCGTEQTTAAWLTARMWNARRRIEVLGWKRLAGIHADAKPGGPVRNAISAEARRCGYTPRTILALNAA